ncbi:MAG TPA: hypothetical protein VHE30_12465 [Polyangiaceae bacterium]|nr:hypothetical protein [Polyangiaceae bacterium]
MALGLRERARPSNLKVALKRTLGPGIRRLTRARELEPLLWGLGRDDEGFLVTGRGGIRLQDVLDRYGSPLFVADASRLDENMAAFRHVPPGARAGVEVFYSYKTNPVSGLLERMHAAGVGAEVISEYELWLAERLGVPGDKIVLNGPGQSQSAIRRAVEIGALIQLNHREQANLVAETARAVGRRARVGLRVVAPLGWGSQFGEPIAGGEALSAFRQLLGLPELDVVSVHSHIGGELATADATEAFVGAVLAFCVTLRKELDFVPEILDVGGSLACPTVTRPSEREQRLNRTFGIDVPPRNPSSVLGIREYVDIVVRRVEESCARHRWDRPRIFVEPGRAMTGNTQMLLCRVGALKSSGAAGLVHAVLDAGINVAEPLRNERHQIFVIGPESRTHEDYRLVGPICTPMDSLAWTRRLPRLTPGTTLAIMDAGAYFVPFSTSFSFPRPAIVLLDKGRATLIRRGETFEDLVGRDVTDGAPARATVARAVHA